MKILIWDKHTVLKDIGGPMGYLFKIHEYIKTNKVEELYFYSDLFKYENHEDVSLTKKSIITRLKKRLLKTRFFSLCLNIKHTYFFNDELSKDELSLIDTFDYIHLHWLSDIISINKYIHSIKPKIILTTHSPEPLVDQIFAQYGFKWILFVLPFVRRYFILKEVRGFGIADYIMFPVPQAKEAYTNVSSLYRKYFERYRQKFFYVPTAINAIINQKNEHVLNIFNIPSSNLKVCFIGRHNKIKGYDILQKIAKSVWITDPNITFIIGGTEKPMKGLNDNRWIELGWVNTYNLLKEVDVFILPNRETYYDLILLEVVGTGTPVIVSNTGGNKWFKQYPNTGIFFYDYDDVNQAVNIIRKIHKMKINAAHEYENLRNSNVKLFNMVCKMNVYMQTYINQIYSIHK